MKTRLSEDFAPVTLGPQPQASGLRPLRDGETMYYLHLPDGTCKTHVDATPKEALDWATSLLGNVPGGAAFLKGMTEDNLRLVTSRVTFLSTVLSLAVKSQTDLFGSSEFWAQIKEWERLQRMEAKDREKEEKKKIEK